MFRNFFPERRVDVEGGENTQETDHNEITLSHSAELIIIWERLETVNNRH